VDLWVLHFVLVFATGEAVLFENTEKFPTEETCKIQGKLKGDVLLAEIMRRVPIPVTGKFHCVLAGADT